MDKDYSECKLSSGFSVPLSKNCSQEGIANLDKDHYKNRNLSDSALLIT